MAPPSVSSPSSSSSPAARPAPLSRPPSNDGVTKSKIYRISSQDRIDDILRAGRRRSEALKGGGEQLQPSRPYPTMSLSPSRHNSVTNPDDHGLLDVGDGSADDQTPIVGREAGAKSRGRDADINYGSTAQPSDTLRSRKSQMSIRRDRERRPAPDQESEGDSDDGPHDESWWKTQLAKYGSIELENKGSVARDHLALERTFLAWLRTSLAFASIGIAVTQLFRLNTSTSNRGSSDSSDPYQHLRQLGKPLGATFLAISIVVLFVGFHRYFEAQHWIIRGKFPASRGSITLVALIAFALMVTSLVVVVVVEPSAVTKRDVLGLILQ